MKNQFKTNFSSWKHEAGRLSKVGPVKELNLFLFFQYFRLLIWALQLDKRNFMKFAVRVRSLLTHNGRKFTVLYLKECYRIVQHFVSGNPVLVTNEVPLSIVRGLPSIIPGVLRLRMHDGDPGVIRGVLTCLSVFRVIKFPGDVKFDTIVGPFTGLSSTLPIYELLAVKSSLPPLGELRPIRWLFSRSAGPNCKVAGLGIWLDIKAWSSRPNFGALLDFIKLFPGGEDFRLGLLSEVSVLRDLPSKVLHLGRLSFKEEAAGKVRVFAITDAVTQSVMAPLSAAIFDCLRRVPQDGTFNQSAPLDRLRQLKREGKLEGQKFYSYDLSAATDRLPVDLQVQILSIYFGEQFGTLWRSVMTDRDWSAKVVTVPGLPAEEEQFRYAVGQPMGALSSWGMLALTHHYVVRLAARRVSLHDFGDYAVLGDDVVIANDLVARSYHSIMVDILGVKINLSKTLVSEHSFEFAKRLVSKDVELTPLGASNALLALQSLNGIPSILRDLSGKGVTFTEDSVDDLISRVPTVRKSQLETILWTIKGPFGFVPTRVGLASFLTMSSSLTPVRANQIIDAVRRVKHQFDVNTWKTAVRKAIEFQISISELYYPVGFSSYPSGFENSSVRRAIVHQNSLDLQSLGTSAPRWRLVFGGPLIMMDYYRASYEQEIVAYIKELITDQSFEVSIGGGDPFVRQTFEDYAFSSRFKGKIFFDQVRETLRQRALPL
uniref:RNA-dependent RNA polymerase n=1 Tax=Macrophomina phaseolina mitovirus 1 TaxID=1708346 RepID=A0A0M3SUP4_9VIRU|nr:RNA-dependent RNA polymerase [Macrophomina phaseolina mitovirus 1]